jgi:hypothetical protein
MLDELASAYHELIEHQKPAQADAARLASIVDDMRWYAERIGAERWGILPRSNRWSFEQHLWHVLKQVRSAAGAGWPAPVVRFINHGKQHVGQIAEVLDLLDESA